MTQNAEITITRLEGNWAFGRIGEYDFQVKHFANPSEFGIEMDEEPGRISKLWVARHTTFSTIANYDRGWDKLPRSQEEIDAVQAIIDRFN